MLLIDWLIAWLTDWCVTECWFHHSEFSWSMAVPFFFPSCGRSVGVWCHEPKRSNSERNMTLFLGQTNTKSTRSCLLCPVPSAKGVRHASRFMKVGLFPPWHRKDLHVPCQRSLRQKVCQVNRATSLSLLFLKQWLRDGGIDADASARW